MSDNTTASVIIVPNAIAEQVRAYAAELAEAQTADVQGFAAGIPDMGRFGSILGRPGSAQIGGSNMITGTNCDTTSKQASWHADDFECKDET